MFNTLKYAKMLEETGFSRDQSEASIEILVEIMDDKLATKQDIKSLEIATKQEMSDLRSATQSEIAGLRVAISDLELRLTTRVGAMMAASVAIITAVNKWG